MRRVRCSRPWEACDRCGRPARRVWNVVRAAIDIDLEHPVLLAVEVSVHHCGTCRRYFRAQPAFLRPGAVYTRRVVAKAVASVFADGMAVVRVGERLARDFWVQPSAATIHRWCREHCAGLDLAADYEPWVVEAFSGILCVDEVYQGRLALLLAVDPAAPEGDRVVGYALVEGKVDQAEMTRFLERLRAAGIAPDEVVTDGSTLYPEVLAQVWPAAAHQLCLFHETRLVVRAAQQVVKAARADLPAPPPARRVRGRPRTRPPGPPPAEPDPASAPVAFDRDACIGQVRALRAQGMPLRGIVRQTGHSRNTVRRWLREPEPPANPAAAGTAVPALPGSARPPAPGEVPVADGGEPEGEPEGGSALRRGGAQPHAPPHPPAPWQDWDQVRRVAQDLTDLRFRIAGRRDRLTEAEGAQLESVLASPLGGPLRVARAFAEDWYAIWRDAAGDRRTVAEARERYRRWRDTAAYAELAPLKRLLRRMTDTHFEHLSAFLRVPAWETTSNGAERTGRAFRHQQAPHFSLRTAATVEGALKARLFLHKERATRSLGPTPNRTARGRPPRATARTTTPMAA